MKRILSVFLSAVLLFGLAACGGVGDKEDPKLGVYEGISVFLLGDETPMTEVYPGDNFLELKAKGKAVFTLDGDAIDCKWELDGTKLVIDIEGEECTGTLKGDVINLDFMGMMDMIFAQNGAYEFDASGKSEDRFRRAGHCRVLQGGFHGAGGGIS